MVCSRGGLLRSKHSLLCAGVFSHQHPGRPVSVEVDVTSRCLHLRGVYSQEVQELPHWPCVQQSMQAEAQGPGAIRRSLIAVSYTCLDGVPNVCCRTVPVLFCVLQLYGLA